jgi:predicted nucleotidyltransferase
MDRTEKIYYLFLDLILFTPIFLTFLMVLSTTLCLLFAFAVAHTFHWLLDGHLYVTLKNIGFTRTELSKFVKYIEGLRERAIIEESIIAVVAFGSLSRGQLTEYSDLDIRIIRKPGFVNGIKSCTFTFFERIRSLLNGIPLDIYTCDSIDCISKMRLEEVPIVIHDPQKKIMGYPWKGL